MFVKHPETVENQYILANQVDAVCQQLKFTLVAHLILGLLAGSLYWGHLSASMIIVWYATLGMINFSRMSLLKYIPDVYIDPDRSVRVAQLNIMAAILSGCLWGLTGLAITVLPESRQYLMFVVLIGLSTGAILSNTVLLPGYLGFAIPILLFLMTGLLIEGGDFGQSGAVMTAVYAIFLIYTSRQLHATIRENIQLRIQQERLSEQVSEEKLRFEYVLDSSPTGIVITDEDGVITYVNTSLLQLFGYAKKELLDEAIEILVPDDKKQDHVGKRIAFDSKGIIRKMGDSTVVFHGRRKDGTVFPLDIGLNTVTLVDQHLTIASVTDLTQHENLRNEIQKQADELAVANAALQDMATQDKLTEIGNRRFFDERIDEQIGLFMRKNIPFSLLLLDIDHFKQYNDEYGHSAGDEALTTLAQVLKEHSRNIDLLARYGGEEFAILLPDTRQEDAVGFAERVRHIIEMHPWRHRSLTISIGVSCLDSVTESPPSPLKLVKQIIDAADHALYESKRSGRNRVTYADTLP